MQIKKESNTRHVLPLCSPNEGLCASSNLTPGVCWQIHFSEYEDEIKASWAQVIADSGFAPLGCYVQYYACQLYANVPVIPIAGRYHLVGYGFNSWRWECP